MRLWYLVRQNNKTVIVMTRISQTLVAFGLALILTACSNFGTRPLAELTQKYADGTSGFVSINGLPVHYRDEGHGEVVLLLHGEHSSLHVWDDWTTRLAKNFRVIRMDLPGHGLTGPDEQTETYDLDYMLALVEEFITKLELDESELHMVGASYGGFVTWNYALRYPDALDSMILVDSTGYEQELHPVLSYNSQPFWGGLNSWILPEGRVRSRLRSLYGKHHEIETDVITRTQDLMMRKGNRDAFIQVAGSMKQQLEEGENDSHRIKYIQTPTLIMWGESDEWTSSRIMKHFKGDLPNGQLVSYEAVGHLPMEELPYQTARDAESFLMTGELIQLPGNQKQGW